MSYEKLNLCWGYKRRNGDGYLDVLKNEWNWDKEEVPQQFVNRFDEILMDNILHYSLHPDEVVYKLIKMSKLGGVIKIHKVGYCNSSRGFSMVGVKSCYGTRSFHEFTIKNDLLKPLKMELVTLGRFRKHLPFKKILDVFFYNIYDMINFEFEVKRK